MNMTHRIGLTLLALTVFASRATAHDFTTSYSHVMVEGRTVKVRLTLNLKDLHVADMASAIEANYHIEGPDAPSNRIVQASDAIAEDVVAFDLQYVFDHPVTSLRITSTLDRITQADHSHIVQIGRGDTTREAVLNASNPSVEAELGEKAFLKTSLDFVK